MRNDPRPFGGMQIILCGDFFQLPPINRADSRQGGFVTGSQVWPRAQFTVCYLRGSHRQKDDAEGQTFTKSINKPVLPDFLSVILDPTREQVGKIDLNGHYVYDDEGVKGRPVTLVENGILKTFLLSRSPVVGLGV